MKAVKPKGGMAPGPRAYHSLIGVGTRHLMLYGGRTRYTDPPPREALGVYDVVNKAWEFPGAQRSSVWLQIKKH